MERLDQASPFKILAVQSGTHDKSTLIKGFGGEGGIYSAHPWAPPCGPCCARSKSLPAIL